MDPPETVSDTILRIISEAGRALATADIIEAADSPPGTVKPVLGALVKSGALYRPRHGYYDLRAGGGSPHNTRPTRNLYLIPLASIQASAGDGSSLDYETEVEAYIQVDEVSVRRETGISPERLVLIIATGDSMLPTILPGDRLWVARTNGEPIRDGAVYIWRSRYDGITVKRARLLENGSIALQGDSEPAPMGCISPRDDDPAWTIMGRVIRVEKPL